MKRYLFLLIVLLTVGGVTFAGNVSKEIRQTQPKADEYVFIDPMTRSKGSLKTTKRLSKEKVRGLTSWEYADKDADVTILGNITSGKLEYLIAQWNHPDTITYSATLLGWKNSNDYYENLIIPDYVTYKGINVPVTTVNPYAFFNGWGLKTLQIGERLIAICEFSFFGCGFNEISIPLNVEMILQNAFASSPIRVIRFAQPSLTSPDLILGFSCFGFTEIKELELPARLQVNHPLSFACLNGSLAPICMSLAKITINPAYKNKKIKTRAEAEENLPDYLDLEMVGDALCLTGTNPQTSQKICYIVQYPPAAESSSASFESDIVEVFDAAFGGSQLDKLTLTANAEPSQENRNIKIWGSAFEESVIRTLELNANGPISISDNALVNCYGLTEIKLSEGITNYDLSDGVMFEKYGENLNIVCYPAGKTDLAYTLPSNVRNIGTGAFSFNTYLQSLRIDATIDSIGALAFSSCVNLEKIEYSRGPIQYIGTDAFINSKVIESAPEGEVLLSNWLIGYNGSVPADYVVSDKANRAVSGVFSGNEELKTIGFPDDFEIIPEDMFYRCVNLEKVVKWPENLKNIESFAFTYCGYQVKGLPNYTLGLPAGLLSVGEYAFYNCKFFNKINFPSSIERVDAYSFVTSNILKEIDFNRTTPPRNIYPDDPIFSQSTLSDCVLKIPQQANPDSFRSDPGWNFSNIIQAELDAVETIGIDHDDIIIEGNSIYSKNGANFEIYDTSGRKIGYSPAISGLPHGMYILKFENKTFKIII